MPRRRGPPRQPSGLVDGGRGAVSGDQRVDPPRAHLGGQRHAAGPAPQPPGARPPALQPVQPGLVRIRAEPGADRSAGAARRRPRPGGRLRPGALARLGVEHDGGDAPGGDDRLPTRRRTAAALLRRGPGPRRGGGVPRRPRVLHRTGRGLDSRPAAPGHPALRRHPLDLGGAGRGVCRSRSRRRSGRCAGADLCRRGPAGPVRRGWVRRGRCARPGGGGGVRPVGRRPVHRRRRPGREQHPPLGAGERLARSHHRAAAQHLLQHRHRHLHLGAGQQEGRSAAWQGAVDRRISVVPAAAPQSWQEKIDAAWNAGCSRFDGAIKGFGGCPMATDKLTGNMPTENLYAYFESKGIHHGLDKEAFKEAMQIANTIFK